MNHTPFYQHLHHPSYTSQQHQDHYPPPPINHHLTPSNVYHHYPSNHLYGMNSTYPPQNSGFGYQTHLYSSPHPTASYPPINESAHYYDANNGSSGGYLQPPPSRIEDKPYIANDFYPTPPPTRYSTGKEYGRVNNNKSILNNNSNKKGNSGHITTNKPSEKRESTRHVAMVNDKNTKLDNNKRKINMDLQPNNKRQKQATQSTSNNMNIPIKKNNEKIVNNNSNNEEKSTVDNLDMFRVLRVSVEKNSIHLSENDIFKYFPNALKVRKENIRDFLVEFSSLVDMIPYIETETKEEETVNIVIPKSLIPVEYLKDTQKLVLEFVEFLKQKQSQKSSNTSVCDSSNWEKLISSIKIPLNVSPYELLEFREKRVRKTLGKKEFGILVHEKPKITDKLGFPIFYNPNVTPSDERFFFFAFCKTGTTFLSRDEISKSFPNAKSVHFDPGDHRIIVELYSQNDFNAYKKISHSGKFMVRNHTFLLRKASIKDIPPEILNPSPPTPSTPSTPPKNANPDKTVLLQQLRQQMDQVPESPLKQNPKELRSGLLAQMKSQQPPNTLEKSKSEQSLDMNFISLSESESSSEDEFDETERVELIEEAPSSPQPQTPQKDKTVLLSALREQMQQSTEKKKEPIKSTTIEKEGNNNTTPSSVSAASSSNNTISGVKRKTFASHYALFHGKFHK